MRTRRHLIKILIAGAIGGIMAVYGCQIMVEMERKYETPTQNEQKTLKERLFAKCKQNAQQEPTSHAYARRIPDIICRATNR